MKTKRAKRLIAYLEKHFGWTCSGGTVVCPKCGDKQYNGKFCPNDGAALKRMPDDSAAQVEEAIAYALEESK